MKIGAFAELTGISAYTLRYYEKKGLLFVKLGQNGCRNYRSISALHTLYGFP